MKGIRSMRYYEVKTKYGGRIVWADNKKEAKKEAHEIYGRFFSFGFLGFRKLFTTVKVI